MLFIGDVDGPYGRYNEIIAGAARSIQVGDLGIDAGRRKTATPPNIQARP